MPGPDPLQPGADEAGGCASSPAVVPPDTGMACVGAIGGTAAGGCAPGGGIGAGCPVPGDGEPNGASGSTRVSSIGGSDTAAPAPSGGGGTDDGPGVLSAGPVGGMEDGVDPFGGGWLSIGGLLGVRRHARVVDRSPM